MFYDWLSEFDIHIKINFLKVLDACSAPGNKTVHLAALMGAKGSIIACELNEERVKRLKETIRLSGASSIRLTSIVVYFLLVLLLLVEIVVFELCRFPILLTSVVRITIDFDHFLILYLLFYHHLNIMSRIT